ncbi:MAG: GreA/GreB family elongation factor [Clostridia bacterium]|nr:GreA/GreB family elongation factor [Clostridia bacterium]
MYDELTEVDIRKMQEELHYRYTVVAPPLDAEVARTRAYGDLSENAEYKVAKQERNKNRARIRYLENMIRTAKVVRVEEQEGVACLFDHVTYRREDTGEEREVQIVTTLRQDPLKGYISKESPLGKALLGSRVGDRITLSGAAGRGYTAVILAIRRGEDDGDIPIASF